MYIKDRVRNLNNINRASNTSNLVTYVMSRDQRVKDNHALLYAQSLGNVLVVFNLYPLVANRIFQQYEFMLEGLKEVQNELINLNIPFVVMTGNAIDNLNLLENYLRPNIFVFDLSPLRGPRNLHQKFANKCGVPVYEVDAHNTIPAWVVSDKEEFGAYTLRPKIYKQLLSWLKEPDKLQAQNVKQDVKINLETINKDSNVFVNPSQDDWGNIKNSVQAEKVLNYSLDFVSGSKAALKILKNFLENKIEFYAEKRNIPTEDFQSKLSPYLHYGQISSLRIVLEVQKFMRDNLGKDLDLNFYKNKAGKAHKANLEDSIYAFIEEVVVRKELADNFCYYNPNYDKVEGAKDWALKSHSKHFKDRREFLYSFEQLEFALTHDPAWNAAQRQLITKGKIHGYMRMYWAKKFLEWTENPRQALEWCIKLNDKYHLDGYDPNGYAGIQWSINGVHDRPWFERPIYGQIRYMSYEGLKKKFDVEEYSIKIDLQYLNIS